jgi:hypothetical protein
MSGTEDTEIGSDEESTEEGTIVEYNGIEINHKGDDGTPNMYAISSTTTNLTEWAEVPRANADFMDGYQRQLDNNRLGSIRRFLDTPENIIPGAILVTVDEDKLNIEYRDGGGVNISIEGAEIDELKEQLEEAFHHLYNRLSSEGQDFVDSIEEAEEDDEIEETKASEEETESSETEQTVSYLARKTGELKETINEFDDLSEDEKKPLKEYADRVTKPGLIIDGQHRVHGGKEYVGDIEYPVVLIPGLEDKEQVYHFYMINDKAEPISQEELLITSVS